MERACSLVTAVRFLTAKNGVDYKFSLHFPPGLWYTCLRNKCHAISTICLQLRESVGCRYRRCVLCSYLEEALTHTVTHTTKRMDGNSGEDRAYFPQYTEWKASKSLKKQRTEYPDTLRNQQVRCSSHPTSSKKRTTCFDKSSFFCLACYTRSPRGHSTRPEERRSRLLRVVLDGAQDPGRHAAHHHIVRHIVGDHRSGRHHQFASGFLRKSEGRSSPYRQASKIFRTSS